MLKYRCTIGVGFHVSPHQYRAISFDNGPVSFQDVDFLDENSVIRVGMNIDYPPHIMTSMFRNYVLIAWRSLLKNKLFSLINIFGLALSVSVCMIVLVRMIDAFEYDTFHHDGGSIYRITSKITNPQGDNWTLASSPLPLKTYLLGDGVEANSMTHFYPAIQVTAKDRSREFAVRGVFIEPSFFAVFGFTCPSGNAEKALTAPNRVLLSQALAEKFYEQNDPTGKTLTLGNLGEFEIAGVISTPPAKSHIAYDVFVSMATVPILERQGILPTKLENWDSFEQGYTYVRIGDATARRSLESKLARAAAEINKTSAEKNKQGNSGSFDFALQPLAAITPGSPDIYNDIGRGTSRGSLLAEGGIVLVILLAACFNYTNLSIARALTRGKEVGIRKLSGAQRWQIFAQYIVEAVLISLFATFLANGILGVILEFKPFNDGYEMVPDVRIGFKLLSVFAGFAVFAGLLAGAIPAWILSSFRPARILRGIGSEKLMGNLSFRKVLMVFQFSLSLVILVFLTVFYRQFDFLSKADPGFYRKNIALIPAGEHPEVTATGLDKIPGIRSTAFTSARFGTGGRVKASRESVDQLGVSMEAYDCDRAWIDMMRLRFVAGTYFHKGAGTVVISEKAAVALGFKSADEAVGALIYLHDSIRATINGVVKDIYTQGYGNAIQPLLFKEGHGELPYIAVETTQNASQMMTALEQVWKKQNPGHSFELRWLDVEMEKENDKSATISLLGFLGFMTVAIASLGLLGLVVYTVDTRRKEISIRKIIGATVHQIVTLLSAGFIKLLLLSGAIALPSGYLLSNFFLMNFVNRITLGVPELLLCFAFLLAIGLITILSQTWKASQENPSRNLRSE
jgi:putative ABC transport system permease protein